MAGMVYTSNNGDRVVDTYGNMITTTDFTIRHEPLRRASFEFTFESDIKIDTTAVAAHTHIKQDGITNDQSNFSFAYECGMCDMMVCGSCKNDVLNEAAKDGA
jgi:hypothetical protein